MERRLTQTCYHRAPSPSSRATPHASPLAVFEKFYLPEPFQRLCLCLVWPAKVPARCLRYYFVPAFHFLDHRSPPHKSRTTAPGLQCPPSQSEGWMKRGGIQAHGYYNPYQFPILVLFIYLSLATVCATVLRANIRPASETRSPPPGTFPPATDFSTAIFTFSLLFAATTREF